MASMVCVNGEGGTVYVRMQKDIDTMLKWWCFHDNSGGVP